MNYANYFDYAAATPLLPEAKKAMEPYFADQFYNPSALYAGARTNRIALEESRHIVAIGLGAKPTEIIFTAGGTEANNLAINGVMQQYPKANMATCSIEHESVLEPAGQYDNRVAQVTQKGIVDVADLQTKIDDNTVLVSIMYANNEVGSIQPLRDVVALVQDIRQARIKKGITLPILLHTDACQASNYLDMQVGRLGVDLLTINAGKIYGPKQCGALFVRSGVQLKPQILGGGQEWRMRSGTENLANIVGFATAWNIVRQDFKLEQKRVSDLRDKAIKHIETIIPNAVINGALHQKRLANNIHLTIHGIDNERVLMELDELGFQVAAGSACSASNDEPSHVLKAMGIAENDALSSIRITLGRYTTEESLKLLITHLAER